MKYNAAGGRSDQGIYQGESSVEARFVDYKAYFSDLPAHPEFGALKLTYASPRAVDSTAQIQQRNGVGPWEFIFAHPSWASNKRLQLRGQGEVGQDGTVTLGAVLRDEVEATIKTVVQFAIGATALIGGVMALQAAAAATPGAITGTAAVGESAAASGAVGGSGFTVPGAGAASGAGLVIPAAPAIGIPGAGLTLSTVQVASFAPGIGSVLAAAAPLPLSSLISGGSDLTASFLPSTSEVAASTVGGSGLVPSAGSGAGGLYGADTVAGTIKAGSPVIGAPSLGSGGFDVGSIINGGSFGEFVSAIPGAVQTAAGTVAAVETIKATINPDGTQSLPAVTVTGKKQSEFPWWIVAAVAAAAFSF
jgi:hypothetical protein